jgi:NADPH:quinone reductase-like Zn-dependent oxidoreductase
MKAIVYTRYGSPEVLHLVDVPKPTPRDHQVLVKVHATTATISDTIMRSLNLPIHGWQKLMGRLILGWNKPRRHILGMELAGEIEIIGWKVSRFNIEDAVFASTFDINFGDYAEYKCLPTSGVIAIKPATLTYEEAAVPGAGQTAWHCLKKGNLQTRQKILIQIL